MKEFFDKVGGPLLVAGILTLITLLFRISMQVQSLTEEIHRNRGVTCLFAEKLGVTLGECRRMKDE